jgi:hypothetical protein
MKDRNRIIQMLTEQYDIWDKQQQKDFDNGSGFKGQNGSLMGFSFDDLFNEVIWRLKIMENEEIRVKLKDLKMEGDIFNQQVGSLYSGITADRINNLLTDLKENYGIDVPYRQPCPGRIDLSILDKLIKRYE